MHICGILDWNEMGYGMRWASGAKMPEPTKPAALARLHGCMAAHFVQGTVKVVPKQAPLMFAFPTTLGEPDGMKILTAVCET